MTSAIERRKFIGLLATAACWPQLSRAQKTGTPVVGFLSSSDAVSMKHLVTAFRDGLDHMGFIDRRNVSIEYRWAEHQHARLPELAEDLVRQGVSVIVASGGEPAASAAQAATKTIPIVFNTNGDPVRLGLAASLQHPGGNLTGISGLETGAVAAKRFYLMRELLPGPRLFGLLANARNVNTQSDTGEARTQAQSTGEQLAVELISDDRSLDAAFAALAQQRVGGLFVQSIHSSPPRGLPLSSWRRVTAFLRSTRGARLPRRAASSAMAGISPTHIGSRVFMPAGFSKEERLPKCPSPGRASSNWSSTAIPPKRSQSRCRTDCLSWRTR